MKIDEKLAKVSLSNNNYRVNEYKHQEHPTMAGRF